MKLLDLVIVVIIVVLVMAVWVILKMYPNWYEQFHNLAAKLNS